MLDIKGDIEKKKAEKENAVMQEPTEEKKPTADEKLKEDYGKVKEVVSKVTAPVKAVWHFVPDTVKTVMLAGLGGSAMAGIIDKAKEAALNKAKEAVTK